MSLLKVDDLGRLLHVEYDYDYRDNSGKQVSIKQGDQYILIKKSNVDWWQVIKLDQKKPFYIPASYVKELPEKKLPSDHAYFNKAFRTLQKQMAKSKGGLVEDDAASVMSSASHQPPPPKERTIYLTRSRDDLNVVSMTGDNSKVHVTRASTDSLERYIESENPYDEVPLQVDIDHQSRKQNKPKLRSEAAYSEPEYENLEVIRRTDAASQQHQVSPPKTTASKQTAAAKPTKKRQSSLSLSPTRLSATDGDHHLSSSPSMMSTFKPTTPTFASLSPPTAMATNHAEEDGTGGWEVMADQQTGNSYLYNSHTGEMRYSGGGDGASSKKHKKKKPPPPVPDVSKKPTNSRKTLSPPTSTSGGGGLSSSGLQRRLSSPARYRSRKNWPVARYRRSNDHDDISTTTTSKLAKDSTVFHDSTNNSPTSSFKNARTRSTKSPRTSSSSSSAMSPVRRLLTPPHHQHQPQHQQSQWYQEASCDDDDSTVVFVNSVTGERWQQMLDDHSQQFYYFNEQSRETAWSLPESDRPEQYYDEEAEDYHHHRQMGNTAAASSSTMKKSFTLERDMDVRLAAAPVVPTPRLRVPLKKDGGSGSGDGSGDSKYTKSLDRNLHVRSMIILRDGEDGCPADYAQSKQGGSAKASDHHSFITEARIQRQGRLNWTKLYEAGKKQRKNWTQQWVVLLANNLLFYKDHKQANPSKTFLNSKPESSCDLRGASIEHAPSDRSSKKNVLELQTVRGLRLLLQHDDVEQAEKWLDQIRRTIHTAVREIARVFSYRVVRGRACSSLTY